MYRKNKLKFSQHRSDFTTNVALTFIWLLSTRTSDFIDYCIRLDLIIQLIQEINVQYCNGFQTICFSSFIYWEFQFISFSLFRLLALIIINEIVVSFEPISCKSDLLSPTKSTLWWIFFGFYANHDIKTRFILKSHSPCETSSEFVTCINNECTQIYYYGYQKRKFHGFILKKNCSQISVAFVTSGFCYLFCDKHIN